MNIAGLSMPMTLGAPVAPSVSAPAGGKPDDPELRKTFDAFVGETFYGQMMAAMRKTVGKPAYFHGGQGEEVFREHLDHVLSQEMAKRNGSDFTDGMFQMFQLSRQ